MGLVTGSGLTNVSDILDALRVQLESHGFTTVINTGTVGSNNKVIWTWLPKSKTFHNQYNMTIGLVASGTTALIDGTPFTPTEAKIGVNPTNQHLGTMSSSYNNTPSAVTGTGITGDVYPSGAVLTGSNLSVPHQVNDLNISGNCLRHWFFTPEHSPISSAEWYIYMVIEVTTGVFRTIAYGCLKKYAAASWSGGFFFDGSSRNTAASTRSTYIFGGGTLQAGTATSGGVVDYNNFDWVSRTPNGAVPWTRLFADAAFGHSVHCVGMDPRGLGKDFFDRSPSAFSGLTVRVPARVWTKNNNTTAANYNFRPLGEFPDVFHASMQDLTPGDVLTDGGEKFLCVSHGSKTAGTYTVGNFGFLIRNPNL